MKNHGLQVAKLSRFKSGPNISVSYVSFLHAARIYLQLGLPILFTTAHNRSEPISRIPPASSKKLRKRTPTHEFQALYRSLASEIAEKPLNVCGQYITA